MGKIKVQAGQSLLEGLIRTPETGVCELIWNAFDADAEKVIIQAEQNGAGGWEELVIFDDGLGMDEMSARRSFETVGDSWKAPSGIRSETKKRALHGRHGRGRYAAFSLGEYVSWTSTTGAAENRTTIEAKGTRSNLDDVEVDVIEAGELKHGTSVRISVLSPQCLRSLDQKEVLRNKVLSAFALHLERHEDFGIELLGEALDPKSLQNAKETYEIEVPDGSGKFELTVIEWNLSNVERKLYLVSDDDAIIDELPPGVQAPGSEFTAYVKWSGFSVDQPWVLHDEEETEAGKVIQAAKEKLREHLTESSRLRERAAVDAWVAEGIYPYSDDPKSEAEKTTRSAYNVVALAFSRTVDSGKSTEVKKMALGLLKEAFEQSPESVLPVLQSVARLPKARIDELRDLLDRTTLADLIASGRMVGDRLDFIQGLNALVFDRLSKKHTKERRQLHRILAKETWIFGEEWSLTGDDVRLTEVLKNHLKLLDNDVELASVGPVVREDGRDGIPDLVFGRKMSIARDSYEQLVVELKRPGHKLQDEDITQIRSYASAINKDDRFSQQNVTWEFWLVGSNMSDTVTEARNQPHYRPGVVQEKPYRIVVKTWAEIITDAEFRLKFLQEYLNYASDHDRGMTYLREHYSEYLPDELLEADDEEAEVKSA